METAEGTDAYRTVLTDAFWTAYRMVTTVEEAIYGLGKPVSPERKVEATRYVLEEMKRTADSIGARLIVVWIPLYFGDTLNQAPPELISLASREGFSLVSMTERFEAMKRNGIPLAIVGDGHMTEAAHEAIASEIIKAVGR
jgi:hypothetical protein